MISAERVYEVFGITPGPWETGNPLKNESNLMIYCDDSTGQRISDCTNHLTFHPIKMKEANAQLVATSPEMLVALVNILVHFDTMGWGYTDEGYNNLIKAIESVDSQNRKWPELIKALENTDG